MSKDIAIIGIAGRFPMAKDLDELFGNLKAGRDCVGPLSKERIRQTALPADGSYKVCGYLEHIEQFDHRFFGLSLAEARAMCPEQRLLLEVVHAAIEHAGYRPSALAGSNTGVYAAAAYPNYFEHATEFVPTLVTGNSTEFLAARVARQFDLKGSVSVTDASCSSALVALHNACNELKAGNAEMAIVTGVHLLVFPFQQNGYGLDLDSPDGKSRAFSAKANGMSYGELAAAVLLKPLEQAMADGDVVHAIIKSTAVNHNGGNSSSMTAPDSRSQAQVLLRAWEKAGIGAEDLSFIEAHGSGTQLGDSLEFEALNQAFGDYDPGRRKCPVSTIKSNTGHGRGAAGLAGLVKVVLALKHRLVFPAVHFEEPSQLIDFAHSNLFVNRELLALGGDGSRPRYAGLTSTGASGTNCHAVLQEALAPVREALSGVLPASSRSPLQGDGGRRWPVVISGKTPGALGQNAAALLRYLSLSEKEDGEKDKVSVADISYTMATGRDHYTYRLAWLVKDKEELAAAIAKDLTNREGLVMCEIKAGRLIFILSDSGGLTEELVEEMRSGYAGFAGTWDSCMRMEGADSPGGRDLAFQYSVYQLLQSLGIGTEQILPLGIGSIVYSVIDGELSLEEGMRAAGEYAAGVLSNKEERVRKLISNLPSGEEVVLLDLSVNGSLREELLHYHDINERIYYTGLDAGGEGGEGQSAREGDAITVLVRELYLRGYDPVISFGEQYVREGRKVSLPGYQFDRVRCWLRDSPKEKEQVAEGDTKKVGDCVVQGAASGTERRIGRLFGEVLESAALSVEDDFFELGGDSLKATRVIVQLNALYRTSLDFEDLFDFPTARALAGYIDAEVGTVKKLGLIWEAVLQTEGLVEGDDFFELGGHSLLATSILVLVNEEFGTALNFEDIFRHSTIGRLAAHIEQIREKMKGRCERGRIRPAVLQDSYAMTYAQRRMWFLAHFVGGNGAYNNVFGVELEGDLQVDLFDRAVQGMVARHESLRTIFRMMEEEPRQFVLEAGQARFATELVDLRDEVDKEGLVQRMFREEDAHAFDLSLFPLFRIRLIRIAGDRHVCILCIHHIISDGWSIGLFLEEFQKNYDELLGGGALAVKPLELQIKDYAEWQYGPVFQEIFREQERYWLEQFSEPAAPLQLPVDRERPRVQSFQGDNLYVRIGARETAKLRGVARENGATLYMVLLAAYTVLLGKLGNARDIAVGTPVAGRRFDGLQSLIGLFVNTIVLRNRFSGEWSFRELLAGVRQTALDAFNNQDYPYEELVKNTGAERDPGRNPLFDTMFILQNNRRVSFDFGGLKARPCAFETGSARFDLLVEVFEDGDELKVRWEYATALFDRGTVERFASYFNRIITEVTEDLNKPIADIEMMSAGECRMILEEFNNTACAFDEDRTIVDLFAGQVARTPDRAAVRCGGAVMSYRELDQRSDRLAWWFRRHCGLGKGRLAGIVMERDEFLLPCLFAILKAGGAYVPIDPQYPVERIRSIVADAGLGLVITRKKFMNLLMDMPCPVLELEEEMMSGDEGDEGDGRAIALGDRPGGRDLAYVIFTSGSTGKPKGVMVEHRSLVNSLLWVQRQYPLGGEDVLLQKTSLAFDVSVWELFSWTFTGASIALLEPGAEKEPAAIVKAIARYGVTRINFVPSMLSAFLAVAEHAEVLADLRSLREVQTSGEALKLAHVEQFGKTLHSHCGTRLVNLYGPTETTIHVSWYACQFTERSAVPIGKPIDNIRCYILDRDLRIVPVGVSGELYIAGAGVARGYLRNEGLTAERFLCVPHLGEETLYKTGDWASWMPDGNILYTGRIDGQVKIRGFRIELGEIESQLARHERIRESAVVVKERNGEQYLLGYYVAEQALEQEALRDHLLQVLPAYMVPTWFVHLERMPVTGSGKTDRAALPDPEIRGGEAFRSASGKVEESLAAIWGTLLHMDAGAIGVHDDFFLLGGHSIMAVRLIYLIQRELGADIQLRDVFELRTIAQQAGWIARAGRRTEELIPAVGKRPYYPATPAQEGLYFEQLLHRENLSYNISCLYEIDGELDEGRLEKAFQLLIDRHEALRTSLDLVEGKVVQRIAGEVVFKLMRIDGTAYARVEDAYAEFVAPFDLSADSLFRCGLMKHELWGNLLFVDIHHIVCDGISLNILMNDFKALYEGRVLPAPALRYVDYACFRETRKDLWERQQAYWQGQLSGGLPVIDLPVMQVRDDRSFFSVSSKVLEVDGELYKQVKQLGRDANVSDYMLLLSVYYILLHKMSGSQDIIIGTDVMGRSHADLRDVVGSFINVLPLRARLDPEESYTGFLELVRETVLGALENQDYPFDRLASLVEERPGAGKRIVDVHFSFANYLEGGGAGTDGGFREVPLRERSMITQYEFKLEASEERGRYRVAFIYCTDWYGEETIDLLMQYYHNILLSVAGDPSLPVGEIRLERAAGQESEVVLY